MSQYEVIIPTIICTLHCVATVVKGRVVDPDSLRFHINKE